MVQWNSETTELEITMGRKKGLFEDQTAMAICWRAERTENAEKQRNLMTVSQWWWGMGSGRLGSGFLIQAVQINWDLNVLPGSTWFRAWIREAVAFLINRSILLSFCLPNSNPLTFAESCLGHYHLWGGVGAVVELTVCQPGQTDKYFIASFSRFHRTADCWFMFWFPLKY